MTTTSKKEINDEILTLDKWKTDRNPINPLYSQLPEYSENCAYELLNNNEVEKNIDSEGGNVDFI